MARLWDERGINLWLIDLSLFWSAGSIEGCSCIDLLYKGHHGGFCRAIDTWEREGPACFISLAAILLRCFRADNVFWSFSVGT